MEQAKRRVPAVAAVNPVDPTAPRGGAERIGAYLARQRQLRGISLEDLARDTRIPLRSLQRLEGGAFDAAPDGFARGFVRTVAIALGLPPDETIARMLPEVDLGDERSRFGSLRIALRVALGLALAAAVIASLGWLASSGGRALAPVFRARHDGLVVRRDAVRALAEEQYGRAPAQQPDRAAGPIP